MATEIIKIVDPDNGSGTDYTSLATWEAAMQKDLVTADEISVAKCRCTGGSADTAQPYLLGWTTDATRYVKIWTDPAESYRHNGTYQTGNQYRIELTGYYSIRFQPAINAKIIGLQLKISGTGALKYGVQTGTGGVLDLTIESCILVDASTATNSYAIHWLSRDVNSVAYMSNNIMYDFKTYGFFDHTSGGASVMTFYLYCNDIINCGTGIRGTGTTFGARLVIKNNICDGNTTADYNLRTGGAYASSGNLSSDATSPEVALQNKNPTYVNEAGDNFHLSDTDTDAKGNGANLYSDSDYPITVDIDGDARPAGGNFDIGADELPDVYSAGKSINNSINTNLNGAIA